MLLTEVVEETSTEITNGFSVTAPQLRLIILAVIVLAICAYFILKPTEERKSTAKNYLNSLATNIMGIVLANIDFRVNSFTGKIETNFDDFKQSLVDEIYKESWDFVETVIKKEVKDGKLDSIASKYIKRQSVESLVDLVMSRDDITKKLKVAYERLSNEVIQEMMKEEEAARIAAEKAEAEEEEPGDPVSEDSVEAFDSGVADTSTNEEDLYEPIETTDIGDELVTAPDKNSVG